MVNIAVLGGTGYTGAAIAADAAARGHRVTSLSRSAPATPIPGVDYVTGSLLDQVADAVVAQAEVAIVAIPPRGELAGEVRGAIARLGAVAADANTRLGVVGGAGSLHVSEGGPLVLESGFPPAFLPEAQEMAAVLDDLKTGREDLDWFFLSPPGSYGAFAPGEAKGTYRVGGDVLLTDEAGRSYISAPDLATAVVDEIENPAHARSRFTVAY